MLSNPDVNVQRPSKNDILTPSISLNYNTHFENLNFYVVVYGTYCVRYIQPC